MTGRSTSAGFDFLAFEGDDNSFATGIVSALRLRVGSSCTRLFSCLSGKETGERDRLNLCSS